MWWQCWKTSQRVSLFPGRLARLGPDVFEVEFLDSEGRTLGFAELKRADFLVLRHDPALAV